LQPSPSPHVAQDTVEGKSGRARAADAIAQATARVAAPPQRPQEAVALTCSMKSNSANWVAGVLLNDSVSMTLSDCYAQRQ